MDNYYEDEEEINEELRRLQEVTEIEANNSDQEADEEIETEAEKIQLNAGASNSPLGKLHL